ncbi:hypothetical protein [Treponema zioleckii]|uniref:hypothetical protein n=1 Tax=Treponema zioleckii TaxID=331680 RepID=UPI00168B69DD|nr:hypothetical protein [Treponema zioleckii]
MAKHVSIKKTFFSIFLILFSEFCFAQDVSQERNVRFFLWAHTDAFPGVDEPTGNNIYSLPVKKIQEIAPFMIQGMVYGWNFEYTPYDKARGVQEYFEFTPIHELSKDDIAKIKYTKPWKEDSRINVWVEFPRTEQQIHLYKSWLAIMNPRIKGVGLAKLSDGFEGIQEAAKEALKQAVRDYERQHIKTKPKEISGKVLMSQPPQIGVDSGRYKVTLEFFMETDRIIEYKTF